MHTADTHPTPRPTRRPRADCCSDTPCESGLRNNYYDGKRLTTESFRLEQRYLLDRRWLLNRAVHGWGVVYGFRLIETKSGWVNTGPGLALDQCGRELLLAAWQRLEVEDLLVLDENRRPIDDPGRAFAEAEQAARKSSSTRPRACWLLSVHYAEQTEGSVAVQDPCRCDRREWDRTCETIRFSLRLVDCDDCCEDFDCELTCRCASGGCCESRDSHKHEPGDSTELKALERGGCRCLCEHLARLPIPECGHLCEVTEPCGRVWVDLQHGVPLACVEIVGDGCDDWRLGDELDACGPRRLVKRNDLLFDLIRGCDLTRISEIGWPDWHRRRPDKPPVPFDDFSDAFGPKGTQQDEYVTERFWVRFSRPVREDTLQPDCFTMTVLSFEREGGWLEARRVPIVGIVGKSDPKDHDPPGHVREARVVVDGRWLRDAVRGSRTLFYNEETWVEIEIRGDFIVDCNGQTVDANPIGLSPSPTGNGTPGGTFLSTFRVGKEYDSSQRTKGASS